MEIWRLVLTIIIIIIIIIIEYFLRITLQYRVLLSTGSC